MSYTSVHTQHSAVVVVLMRRNQRPAEDYFCPTETVYLGRKIGLLCNVYRYWTSCNKPSHCIAPRDITFLLHDDSLLSQFLSCLHKSITCRCHMHFPGAQSNLWHHILMYQMFAACLCRPFRWEVEWFPMPTHLPEESSAPKSIPESFFSLLLPRKLKRILILMVDR